MKDRRGFSLLELLVVTVLLSLAVAVTAPAFRIDRDDPVTTLTDSVVKVFHAARNAALNRAQPVAVVMGGQAGEYRIVAEVGDSVANLHTGRWPVTSNATIRPDSTGVTIRWLGTGEAVPDSVAVSGDGGTAVITVQRWNGAIDVRR